jgi:hypothetical protein
MKKYLFSSTKLIFLVMCTLVTGRTGYAQDKQNTSLIIKQDTHNYVYVPQELKQVLRIFVMNHPAILELINLNPLLQESNVVSYQVAHDLVKNLIQLLQDAHLKNYSPEDPILEILTLYLHNITSNTSDNDTDQTTSHPGYRVGPGRLTSNLDGNDFYGDTTLHDGIMFNTLSNGMVITDSSGVVSSTATTQHAIHVGDANGHLNPLSLGTNGQVLIAATNADPAFATITSTNGTIDITPGANTLNIDTDETIPDTFNTDDGAATPASRTLTVAGGSNINTEGSGSTVTVNLNNSVSVSGSLAAGTTVTGATGLIATTGGITATGNSSINASGTGTTAIGTGTNSGTIALGNTNSGAFTIDCGTAGINIGVTANNHITTLGSTNATSATIVQGGTGAGGVQITANDGGIEMNSGSGTINISANAANTAVNIATNATVVKALTLGSLNSTSSTAIQGGSNGIALTATNGAITANSGTGTVGISTDATATTINIATGAGVKTTTLGSGNGASATTINCGTAGLALGTTGNAHQTTVGSTATTSATTIDCGTGGLNLGTSANAHITTLGSTTGTSQSVVQSGSGGIEITTSTGGINIRAGNGTINIADDALAEFVNIATGAANKVVTLGSTNSTASTTIQAGSGGIALSGATTVTGPSSARALTVTAGTGQQGLLITGASGAAVATFTPGAATAASAPVFNNLTGVIGTGLVINGSNQLCTGLSSKAYKENFRSLGTLPSVLYNLEPLLFDFKNGGGNNVAGFIAEDVEQVAPALVNYDDRGQVRSIRNECLIALAIKELQKHQQNINELQQYHQQNINNLKTIAHLIALVQQLQTRMNALEISRS